MFGLSLEPEDIGDNGVLIDDMQSALERGFDDNSASCKRGSLLHVSQCSFFVSANSWKFD